MRAHNKRVRSFVERRPVSGAPENENRNVQVNAVTAPILRPLLCTGLLLVGHTKSV
jgi:hypothetical protein